MPPETMAQELAKSLEASIGNELPEAIDVSLAAGGDVLCINVGSGALFFKLGNAAKEPVKNLGATIGKFRR